MSYDKDLQSGTPRVGEHTRPRSLYDARYMAVAIMIGAIIKKGRLLYSTEFDITTWIDVAQTENPEGSEQR